MCIGFMRWWCLIRLNLLAHTHSHTESFFATTWSFLHRLQKSASASGVNLVWDLCVCACQGSGSSWGSPNRESSTVVRQRGICYGWELLTNTRKSASRWQYAAMQVAVIKWGKVRGRLKFSPSKNHIQNQSLAKFAGFPTRREQT